MSLTAASEKGLRSYQEDRHVVYSLDEGLLLAVFDGHGGHETSHHCSERLIAIFHEVRNRLLVVNFENLIYEVFRVLNKETQHSNSGAAASIVFLPESGKEAIVGILGDAPVLIKQANGQIWLSPEHNVRSNKKEAEAAQGRGGFIQGGYLYSSYSGGGLQMSRALGDVSLDKVLSREPEIFRIPLNPKSFVLVATDGLFDPSHMSDDPATDIANEIEAGADAKKLVQNALAVPTGDNVTAILARVSDLSFKD